MTKACASRPRRSRRRRDEAPTKPHEDLPPADSRNQPQKPAGQPAGAEKAGGHASARRRLMVGLVALAASVAAGAGYIWWDNASHFESTDDAFIAARSSPSRRRCRATSTAVPVTDNQHVETGQVIAAHRRPRLSAPHSTRPKHRSRPPRRASPTSEAQLAVQQAQVAPSEAQVQQAEAALTFAQQQAARYSDLAKEARAPCRTRSSILRSCASSRPR